MAADTQPAHERGYGMHLLILHQYFSMKEGDSSARFYQVGRRLASAGHQVTVITGNSAVGLALDRKKIGLLQKDGLAVVTFNIDYAPEMKTREKRRVFLSFARQASRQGRRLPRPDIILASSPPLTVGLPALSLSRHYRVPLVMEVRELWPDAVIHRNKLRNKTLISLARRLEQKMYRRSVHIIATTPAIASAVHERTGPGAPVTIIPEDFDEERLCQQFNEIFRKTGAQI